MQQPEKWKRIAAVALVAVFGVATLVASGGGEGCGALELGTCVDESGGSRGGTNAATAKRFPVVAVVNNELTSAGTRAAILTTGRENDDSQQPVQKFGSEFSFVPPALHQPTALASRTSQTFIASIRPDRSGRNDSLAVDAFGEGMAIWFASNAGTLELYASQFTVSYGWFPQSQLLATSISGDVTGHRIAMNGFGRVLVAWGEGSDLIHTHVYLPSQGWLPPATIVGVLSDVAMRRDQGHVLFVGSGGLFIAELVNLSGSAAVRLGSSVTGSARLAVHRDAPDGSLIAVWGQTDGIYFNRMTVNGPEFPNGQKIPGSDNGTEPQVVMGANEETTVIWGTVDGTFANRAIGRVWGTAERIEGGSNYRLAGDALGNAVVVTTGAGKVFATRFIRGSGWQPRQEIGADLVAQGVPDVAMDGNGRALVVWEQVITATPDPFDTRIATAVIGAPIARFSSSPDPALVGVTVVFDANASSDPGGSIARYDWDYTGDGVTDAANGSAIFNHVFTQAGTYRVKLVVTDNSGLVSEAFKDVVVGASSLYGTNLLVNSAFDSAVLIGFLPTAPGNWRGDVAVSVGADRGIAPRSAPNMLRFDATGDVTSTNTFASQQWQIFDVSTLAADIAAGRVRADASAWFNRVVGDLTTDRRFDIRLLAFNVAAADLPAAYEAGTQLAVRAASIQTAGNAWQQAALNMILPDGTKLLLVEIYAFEDVVNDGTTPEFAGHYADDISLVLTRN